MIAHAAAARKKELPAVPGWRDELDLVTWPAALFVAVLACALLAVGVSSWARADKDAVLEHATRVRQQAAARYRNVETEKREIRLYQPRFTELLGAGLIGAENRLGWIEAVRQAQAAHHLPSVSYEIEPQQALRMDGGFELGDYQLRASRMQLHLGLVHEGDLFDVLADLRNAGLFTAEACKLRRDPTPPGAGAGSHVLADCSLVWLSLAPPSGTPQVARSGLTFEAVGSGLTFGHFAPAKCPNVRPDPTASNVRPHPEGCGHSALGRLFSTPDERQRLDAQRGIPPAPAIAEAPPPAAPPPAPPEPVTVDGVVRRSNGVSTVWLNQQPRHDAHISGPLSKPLVSVPLASGATVLAKPGQRVDVSAGTVREDDAHD